MKDVLNAVYHERLFRMVFDCDDAFDPQHLLSAQRGQQLQPIGKQFPGNRRVDDDAVRSYPVVMPVHVVGMTT